MKSFLRKAAYLALGMTWSSAQAQELNFRAVVKRPAAEPMPISVSAPVPLTQASYVARGKAIEEAPPLVVPEGVLKQELKAPNAGKGIPRPMPLAPGDFIAPPPTVGGAMAPSLGSGSVVPHVVTSGPIISDGSSACGSSDTGGGMLSDACCSETACGNICDTGCFGRWRPFRNLAGLFDQCDPCCGPRYSFWVRGEFLLWAVSGQNIPPLATQAASGLPGNLPLHAGSTVIYDDGNLPIDLHNGARISLGFWFPRNNDWGLDASFFYLGARHGEFAALSNGVPGIGRPYIEQDPTVPNTPLEVAQIVAAQGIPGGLSIGTETRIWGLDVNLRRKWLCGSRYWIDGLVGYRHFQLNDTIDIAEDIRPTLPNPPIPGQISRFTVQDHFATWNTFNGGQVGLEGEWRFRPRLTLGGFAKLAAGNVHQVVVIDGVTSRTLVGGGPQFQRGGLLAQPSNMGRHAVDRFAVLPEVGIKLGLDVTDHLRLYAGYNVLYLSNVVRAGEQIDRRVNSSQFAFAGPNGQPGTLVGPALPAVLFNTTEFWAQGVNFGLEWHY